MIEDEIKNIFIRMGAKEKHPQMFETLNTLTGDAGMLRPAQV